MAVSEQVGARTAALIAERERVDLGLRRHVAGVRRARARRAAGRRRRPRVHRLRRRHRHPQRRPHARGGRRARSRSRPRSTCTSATPSRSTSRTSRSSSASASSTRAPARTRACSSTPAPRPSRTPSRSRATPPGRQAIVVLRPGVPRPHAADDDADLEGDAVQEGLRPVRARGLPRARPVPVPRHLRRPTPSPASEAVQEPDRPVGRRGRHLRAGAGRGRLPARARGLPAGAHGVCRGARHPLHRRRGAGRHVPHRPGGLRSSTSASSPTSCVWGKSMGGGCRSPASPAAPTCMDARARRRPRRHVRRQPDLLRRRHRVARRGARPGLPGALARSSATAAARAAATTSPSRIDAIGDVRGLGAMLGDRAGRGPPDARRRPPPWPAAPSSSPASAACC